LAERRGVAKTKKSKDYAKSLLLRFSVGDEGRSTQKQKMQGRPRSRSRPGKLVYVGVTRTIEDVPEGTHLCKRARGAAYRQ